MADQPGWLERKAEGYLAKRGYVCTRPGDEPQFYASQQVTVDRQHAVGASTLMTMEKVDQGAGIKAMLYDAETLRPSRLCRCVLGHQGRGLICQACPVDTYSARVSQTATLESGPKAF